MASAGLLAHLEEIVGDDRDIVLALHVAVRRIVDEGELHAGVERRIVDRGGGRRIDRQRQDDRRLLGHAPSRRRSSAWRRRSRRRSAPPPRCRAARTRPGRPGSTAVVYSLISCQTSAAVYLPSLILACFLGGVSVMLRGGRRRSRRSARWWRPRRRPRRRRRERCASEARSAIVFSIVAPVLVVDGSSARAAGLRPATISPRRARSAARSRLSECCQPCRDILLGHRQRRRHDERRRSPCRAAP